MPDFQTLYESLTKVVERQQCELAYMKSQISLCEEKGRQWELEKIKQQQIFQQMLEDKNREHNEILEENQRLREELRRFKVM